jgi:hypothetical protein
LVEKDQDPKVTTVGGVIRIGGVELNAAHSGSVLRLVDWLVLMSI